MKRSLFKDFAPVLLALVCAALVGVLLLTGALDLESIPGVVRDNHALAVVVVLALFLLKGLCGVILYNALIIVVSLIFPLWEALLLNAAGTALTLSVSYWIGRFTKTGSLEQTLEKHAKIRKYFSTAQKYGFVFCFAIHLVGLNMEVLGILFGMLRIGYLRYLISSWLGIIPGMICFVIMGNTRSLSSPVFWIILAVDLILMVFAFLYTRQKVQTETSAP